MTTILGILFLALALSAILTLLMMRVATGFGIMDRPDATRHFHGRAVPKLGGVAVFVAFTIPVLLLTHMEAITLTSGFVLREFFQIVGLLTGAGIVLLSGLVDDIMNLRPRWKVLWQIVGASAAYHAGFTITAFALPLLGVIELGALSFPATILWFLMCMNAVNLLDGHDGLAAGACLFVGLTLMLVCIANNNTLGALLMASFAGAILGFLFFNFPPAKIFLGDSGSLVLGFLVAGLSLVGATMKAETAFSLLVPIVAMGLPFFDTLFAIMRRVYARMPVSMGDRGHLHHILGRMGYSPRRVVVTLYGVTVLLCALALAVTVLRNEMVLIIILVLVAVAFVTVRVVSGISPEQMVGRYVGDRALRSRVIKSRMVLENSIDSIQHAASADAAWMCCANILADVGVASAQVSYSRGNDTEVLSWPDGFGDGDAEKSNGWRLCIPFTGEGDVSGHLEIGLREAEHGLAALPEFVGLVERMRVMLAEQLVLMPGKSAEQADYADSSRLLAAPATSAEPASTFAQRAWRHIKKYGVIHAVASFAGRFSPGLWRALGPAATSEMIMRWLDIPQKHILNLGAGINRIEGCLNVDIDPRAEVYLDVTRRFPIPSSSVDAIFCEEVVEHVGEADALSMLSECVRILRPGGAIRIITPDLNYLAGAAGAGARGEQQINEAFLMHDHRHIYSRESMLQLLDACGFSEVKHSAYRSEDSDLGYLDSHADRFSHPPEISQYVEARKPGRS